CSPLDPHRLFLPQGAGNSARPSTIHFQDVAPYSTQQPKCASAASVTHGDIAPRPDGGGASRIPSAADTAGKSYRLTRYISFLDADPCGKKPRPPALVHVTVSMDPEGSMVQPRSRRLQDKRGQR